MSDDDVEFEDFLVQVTVLDGYKVFDQCPLGIVTQQTGGI